jgi:hypothetical protein
VLIVMFVGFLRRSRGVGVRKFDISRLHFWVWVPELFVVRAGECVFGSGATCARYELLVRWLKEV